MKLRNRAKVFVRKSRISVAVRAFARASAVLSGLLLGVARCVEPAPRLASPRLDPGQAFWACGFPAAAVDVQVQHATVVLRVHVEDDGAPSNVQILHTTSPLFITHTRQCALAHYYEPAYDADDRRAAGWTAPFRIHYVR